MRLSISHKTGFRYASRVGASYNEARMTPATTANQTVWSSRVSIDPAAWSFSYTDYWGTTVTTFEVHERHERLTVHAQAVVESRGDDLAWDTERRVAENDLGWAALLDRGVTDSMSEFLTFSRLTEPPEELAALARDAAGQPRAAGGAGHLRPDRGTGRLPTGLHQRHQHGRRGLGGRAGRLPGLLPPGHRGAALDRNPGSLRVGIPASGPARRTQRDRHR